MPELCELCRQAALEPVYVPDGTAREIRVFLCGYCGLVQSLPRADTGARLPPAVSGGADWGNVRYGKGFRTPIALDAIARHADLTAPLCVLDVGSNRGRFAKSFLDAASQANLVAVEPDERVAGSCADFPRCELIGARIEQTAFADESFDIVHSCHTVEHLAHPLTTLRDHARVLKPGGILVLDCPNIALIGAEDVIEEWFIDKHLTHFSSRTLLRMLKEAGFEILEPPVSEDRENLFVVARKSAPADGETAADPSEVAAAAALISTYERNLARNRAALKEAAAELAGLAPKGVAMWGAGRIFDALVRHGGFEADSLATLIDIHLKGLVGERFGRPLEGPEALCRIHPGVVVVMSRGFAQEIETEARNLAPQAEIIRYRDLLDRALKRTAAKY